MGETMDRDYRGSGCAVGDGMPCFCCAQSIFAAGTSAAGQTGTEKADGEAGKPGRTEAGWKAGRYKWKPEGICTWKASRIGRPMTAGIQEGEFPSLPEEVMFPEVAAPRNRLSVPTMKVRRNRRESMQETRGSRFRQGAIPI